MAKNDYTLISGDAYEIEEVGNELKQQINQALQKENVTDKVIASLKEKYGGLKLRDENDKEQYLIIKDARKEVRKVGILAERICEAGRSDAIKIQKLWLSKQKEVLEKIGEVQDNLDAEIKKFDDEVERKDNLERQRKENEYMQRQSLLFKYGANFLDGSFVINHISYEATIVKESDTDIWEETILPKYKREWERVESVRVAEEAQRKQEMEAMRLQQEEIARQQRELREAQEEIRLQKEESEKQKRIAAQKEEDEIKNKLRAILQVRSNQLVSLGMTFDFRSDAYVFQDVNVDNATEVCMFNDTQWDELIDMITPAIEKRKKEIEEKRKAKIEEDIRIAKEEAARRERLRMEQEQREKEEREEAEAFRKAQALAEANDKTKWQHLVDQINSIQMPEMKSGTYRKAIQSVNKMFIEINGYFK